MAEVRAVSIDGRIGDPSEATISVLDDGLLRGDGAFEMIKLYEGHPFRLDDHLARIGRSAAAIELDFDESALRAEIAAALERDEAGGAEAGLRIVLTRGGRRLLMLETLPVWEDTTRVALITLTPSEILGGVKSISYAANMQATRLAKARGSDEAVFVRPDDIVLEAPTSSIFWVDADGVLKTPALEVGILDSITRDVLVEGTGVEEGSFDHRDLHSAREAFLASTTREVQAISAVDGIAPAEPEGGAATAEAKRVLAEAVERERAGS